MSAVIAPRSSAEKESVSALLTVERGMQVLRSFRASRLPLSNAEIVRRTGLSKATVSRLTTTLMQLGFLRHVPGSRAFELGSGPLSIGHSFIETSPLLRRAGPLMQELADRLDVSVALALGDQSEMLYIANRTSHRIATLRLGVGSLLPMGTTSIGRAWLWALPLEQRDERIAVLRREAGAKGAALEKDIRASFAELAATGVCAVLGRYQRSTWGVATPLYVGVQRVPMAMSCGAVEVEPDLEAVKSRIGPQLKAEARKLETLVADLDGPP